MRLGVIGMVSGLLLIISIRIFVALGHAVPAFVEYYLLLIILAALPVAVLLWLTTPAGVTTAQAGRVPGMLDRLLKGLMACFAAIYGLGLVLMATG